MEASMRCFIHKTTHEVVAIPDVDRFPGISWDEDEEDDENGWKAEIDKVFGNPEYIEIEKMESFDSFKVMEDFVLSLPNNATRIRLITVLEGYKPFSNFKHQIENAGAERELWFKFRRERGIEWVSLQLEGRI